jgi:hypothetical protein
MPIPLDWPSSTESARDRLKLPIPLVEQVELDVEATRVARE